jgi:hypothetical protein
MSCGNAARVVRTAAIRVKVSEANQSSSVTAANPLSLGVTAPTLWTRVSNPPNSAAPAINAPGPSGVDKSTGDEHDMSVGFHRVQFGAAGPSAGNDLHAFGDQCLGHGQPDALAGAGDDRDLASQMEVHVIAIAS